MIYVIAPEESSVVKIGHTTVEPARRVAGLQTGNPERLVLRWSGEGDEKLEKHLHVVFKDYRVQGEWFDLAPLGDPVQAVRDEVSKAHERLAKGEGLLISEPYRYPVQRTVWTECDEDPNEVIWDPEVPPSMRRGLVYMPPQRWPDQTWDERFPPPAALRWPSGDHDIKPGCIRGWQEKCQRPAGTTCDC